MKPMGRHPNPELMVYLGVRIPKTLEQQLRAMADADHRSLAEYVRLLLIKHTEEETGE